MSVWMKVRLSEHGSKLSGRLTVFFMHYDYAEYIESPISAEACNC